MAAVVPKYAMLLIVYVICEKLTKCVFLLLVVHLILFYCFFIKKDMNVRVCVSAYMPRFPHSIYI